MATFADRLKSLRKERQLTIEQLAQELGSAKSTISRYENDKREPKKDFLEMLSLYFNVSVDYLLGKTETRNLPTTKEHEIIIPKEYSDKYKVTSRDAKQYEEEMKKANEAFFLNDDLSEDAKKEMLDLMSELFWKAKAMNKRKPKEK